jgi:hypothetical protein
MSRPYSQNELREMERTNLYRLHVGEVFASHDSCGHFYRTKHGGKKESEILGRMTTQGHTQSAHTYSDQPSTYPQFANTQSDSNGERCSVCWKLNHGYGEPELVNRYMCLFSDSQNEFFLLTPESVSTESEFYNWLYSKDNVQQKPEYNSERTSGRRRGGRNS